MRRGKKVSSFRRPVTLPKVRESKNSRIITKSRLLQEFYGPVYFKTRHDQLMAAILRDEARRAGESVDLHMAINVVVEMAYSVFQHPDKCFTALQPIARLQLESLDKVQDHASRMSRVTGHSYTWVSWLGVT